MTVAAGLEIEPAGAQAPRGLQAAHSAPSAAGAANFQSSWQSLLASLGTDIDAGATAKSSLSPAQNLASAAQGKDARAVTSSNSNTNPNTDLNIDFAQASIARFAPNQNTVFRREIAEEAAGEPDSVPAGAMSGAASADSDIHGRAARREAAAEKKSATTDSSATSSLTQNAQALLAMAAAVPQSAAQLQQQKAGTMVAHPVENFYTGTHGTITGGTGKHNPGMASVIGERQSEARGILPFSGNRNAVENSLEASAKPANSSAETHAATSAHAHSAEPIASSASAAQSALQSSTDASAGADASLSADADADALKDTATAAASLSSSAQDASALRTASAIDKRSGEPAAARAAHGIADTAAPLSGHASALQPVGAGGESSALGRDASAIGTAAVNSAASKTSIPGAHEAFAALDADAAHGPSWLRAGTHSAEAGFEDPSLGWISVRADMAAGGVHAAVLPGTAEAAQTLGAHMAGLNHYLGEQRTPVHTLTLASPGADPGTQTGTQAGTQSGTAQHGQDSGAGDNSGAQQAVHTSVQIFDPSAQPASTATDAPTAATGVGAAISLTSSISLIA